MTDAERYDEEQASCRDCYNMMNLSFSRACLKHTNPALAKVLNESADRYERMGTEISEAVASRIYDERADNIEMAIFNHRVAP
jgi:hypothetical protein